MYTVQTFEYELMLAITEQLQSTLDLKRAIGKVAPLLQQLVAADHVAIAVSRPGSMYDYEWYNTTLPESFLGNYAAIAERDFVREAVAPVPNRVLVDQQMITRNQYDRHIVNQHARATGANLEHVMAVMLCHEQEWSSGLSLYRSRKTPFAERQAALLQRLVPHIGNAVRNSREHAILQREAWLEPVLEQAGLAAIWLDCEGREIARTARATLMLEQHFAAHERPVAALPAPLRDYARLCMQRRTSRVGAEPFVRDGVLNSLQVSLVALPERELWALVFKQRGLDAELAAKLSPRLAIIAGYLLRGLSSEEIAKKEDRALATIKQQAGQIYDRLGVNGRKGLIQLAAGFLP